MNLYTAAKDALEESGGAIEDAARLLLCDADVRHILHEPFIGVDPLVIAVINRARLPVRVA